MADIPGSDEFDAQSLENSDQKFLRDEFNTLTILNKATLDNFDPQAPDSRADIHISNSSIEDRIRKEPAFVKIQQERMLRELGIPLTPSTTQTENHLFHYEFGTGDFQEIFYLKKTDGVQVPIFVSYVKERQGYSIKDPELLSNDQAQRVKAEIENYIKRAPLDRRLFNEFGIDPRMIAEMPTEEVEAMLKASDQIKTVETIRPDLQALDGIRLKLARAMLPASEIVKKSRAKHLPQLIEEYEIALNRIATEQIQGQQTIENIYESERLERLSALNKQVKARKRVLKAANVGRTTALTGFGLAGGALAGYIVSPGPIGPIVGATLGTASGIGIGVDNAIGIKRVHERFGSFTEMPSRENTLTGQIGEERDLALRYLQIARFS